MKQFIITTLIVSAIAFTSCNSNSPSSKKKEASGDKMAMNNNSNASADAVNAPIIKVSLTNVSSEASSQIKEVLSHYFHVKHALTSDDAAEAKNGATMLFQVISGFDNSLLTADQKTEYEKHIKEIKDHAQYIISSNDIEAERTHFSELSTHTYELVKAFAQEKKSITTIAPWLLTTKVQTG